MLYRLRNTCSTLHLHGRRVHFNNTLLFNHWFINDLFLIGTQHFKFKVLLTILAEIDKPNMGFTEITRLLLGEKYVIINRSFVVVMQWGCCASYILFFMEFFEYAIYKHTTANFEHEIVYLCFALCIITPLIFINNMAVFTKFSAASNV